MKKQVILCGVVILFMSLFLNTSQALSQETRREKIRDKLKERVIQRIKDKRHQGQSDGAVQKGSGESQAISFFTQDNRERTYILYTPPVVIPSASGADLNKKMPLMIVLHGTYGSGQRFQKMLGLDPYADDHGFLVAYPDAYIEPGKRQTTRWNDGRETLRSSELGVDDVAFIKEMIEDIDSRVPVDRKKIFVTGASNGGIMSYRLGCEASEVFAGIAPVIGNIAEPLFDRCNPKVTVSLLSINGTQDPFILINGGEVCKDAPDRLCEGGYVVSMEKSVGKFLTLNGCSPRPKSEYLPVMVEDGTKVEKLTYNCTFAGGNIKVVSYVVHGGGHTWPPRQSIARQAGKGTQNLDATKEIIETFFKK